MKMKKMLAVLVAFSMISSFATMFAFTTSAAGDCDAYTSGTPYCMDAAEEITGFCGDDNCPGAPYIMELTVGDELLEDLTSGDYEVCDTCTDFQIVFVYDENGMDIASHPFDIDSTDFISDELEAADIGFYAVKIICDCHPDDADVEALFDDDLEEEFAKTYNGSYTDLSDIVITDLTLILVDFNAFVAINFTCDEDDTDGACDGACNGSCYSDRESFESGLTVAAVLAFVTELYNEYVADALATFIEDYYDGFDCVGETCTDEECPLWNGKWFVITVEADSSSTTSGSTTSDDSTTPAETSGTDVSSTSPPDVSDSGVTGESSTPVESSTDVSGTNTPPESTSDSSASETTAPVSGETTAPPVSGETTAPDTTDTGTPTSPPSFEEAVQVEDFGLDADVVIDGDEFEVELKENDNKSQTFGVQIASYWHEFALRENGYILGFDMDAVLSSFGWNGECVEIVQTNAALKADVWAADDRIDTATGVKTAWYCESGCTDIAHAPKGNSLVDVDGKFLFGLIEGEDADFAAAWENEDGDDFTAEFTFINNLDYLDATVAKRVIALKLLDVEDYDLDAKSDKVVYDEDDDVYEKSIYNNAETEQTFPADMPEWWADFAEEDGYVVGVDMEELLEIFGWDGQCVLIQQFNDALTSDVWEGAPGVDTADGSKRAYYCNSPTCSQAEHVAEAQGVMGETSDDLFLFGLVEDADAIFVLGWWDNTASEWIQAEIKFVNELKYDDDIVEPGDDCVGGGTIAPPTGRAGNKFFANGNSDDSAVDRAGIRFDLAGNNSLLKGTCLKPEDVFGFSAKVNSANNGTTHQMRFRTDVRTDPEASTNWVNSPDFRLSNASDAWIRVDRNRTAGQNGDYDMWWINGRNELSNGTGTNGTPTSFVTAGFSGIFRGEVMYRSSSAQAPYDSNPAAKDTALQVTLLGWDESANGARLCPEPISAVAGATINLVNGCAEGGKSCDESCKKVVILGTATYDIATETWGAFTAFNCKGDCLTPPDCEVDHDDDANLVRENGLCTDLLVCKEKCGFKKDGSAGTHEGKDANCTECKNCSATAIADHVMFGAEGAKDCTKCAKCTAQVHEKHLFADGLTCADGITCERAGCDYDEDAKDCEARDDDCTLCKACGAAMLDEDGDPVEHEFGLCGGTCENCTTANPNTTHEGKPDNCTECKNCTATEISTHEVPTGSTCASGFTCGKTTCSFTQPAGSCTSSAADCTKCGVCGAAITGKTHAYTNCGGTCTNCSTANPLVEHEYAADCTARDCVRTTCTEQRAAGTHDFSGLDCAGTCKKDGCNIKYVCNWKCCTNATCANGTVSCGRPTCTICSGGGICSADGGKACKKVSCIICNPNNAWKPAGDTNGDGKVDIFDCLEILKFLIGMKNTITDGGQNISVGQAKKAAVISTQGAKAGEPTIFCVLEILKYMIKMPSTVNGEVIEPKL
ncbi:MAG: hypothetical protein FWG33_02290 [Oscillospiraceae bacterium]|nr:hypothetical protein [Oscillospiraceae bacterium]